jgi:hypothetical protein
MLGEVRTTSRRPIVEWICASITLGYVTRSHRRLSSRIGKVDLRWSGSIPGDTDQHWQTTTSLGNRRNRCVAAQGHYCAVLPINGQQRKSSIDVPLQRLDDAVLAGQGLSCWRWGRSGDTAEPHSSVAACRSTYGGGYDGGRVSADLAPWRARLQRDRGVVFEAAEIARVAGREHDRPPPTLPAPLSGAEGITRLRPNPSSRPSAITTPLARTTRARRAGNSSAPVPSPRPHADRQRSLASRIHEGWSRCCSNDGRRSYRDPITVGRSRRPLTCSFR